jgi:hypothetical protein
MAELSLGEMTAQLERMGIGSEGCMTKEDCVARLLEFKAALDAKDRAGAGAGADGEAQGAHGAAAAGVQGGRRVDGDGVNAGALRCPRCTARLVSRKATLVERAGGSAGGEPGGEQPAEGLPLAVPLPDGTWEETRHRWWWRLADHNDFDNVAMSHFHDTPHGRQRYPLCPECMLGPLGLQTEGCAEVLLACELLTQQDLALASDAQDFRAPPGVDVGTLKHMMAAGMGSVTFPVTFAEQRLGLQIQDVEGEPGAVEVAAFTEQDGVLGPAELCGKIQVGDRPVRVNGDSCLGLDYAAVLDLIIGAARPVTIVFERGATMGARVQGGSAGARVAHEEWAPASPDAARDPPPGPPAS